MHLKNQQQNPTNDKKINMKNLKLKEFILNKSIRSFLLGALIGLIIFIFIYGFKVLNVTYDEWLYNSGDLTQHYIGWSFFRNSPWTFPLGMSTNYAYPFGVAMTYTDSIPLFAIFFKLLSPILPKTFQYFGFYQLLNFMLQGGFSAIIVRKYIKNNYVTTAASALLVVSPILLRRVFIHTALTSQWLILFSIAIWVYRYKFKSLKSKILIWMFINLLAVLNHPYFMPMTLIIMVTTILADSINLKSIKEMLAVTIPSLISVVIVFWLIGGFTGYSLEAYGFGRFSMNLNAFFDSNGWSKVFKDLPTVFPEQYEGFQYLGLGVILLIPLAIIFLIKNLASKKLTFKTIAKKYYSLLIVIIPLFILAASTTIAINENTLISYSLPKSIESILSIFRSTGRLFWPVTYIFILFLIIYVSKNIRKKSIVAILLSLLSIVQILDIYSVITESQRQYKEYTTFDSILKSELWDDVGKNYKHIMIIPAYDSTYSYFSKLATKYNMTLNTGSFARAPYDEINALAESTALDLVNGISNNDTIYIIQKFGLVKDILTNDKENKFIVAKVDNTDNCFAIFRSDSPIDFNKYGKIKTYRHDDFKYLSTDNYFDYLKGLPDNVAIIASTMGDSSEFIDNKLLNQLKALGLLKNIDSFDSQIAYVALKTNGENSVLYEKLEPQSAALDFEVNTTIGEYSTKRIININGSAIENNIYSINLLDGFQHSFDSYGINFLIYDLKEDRVLDTSLYDPNTQKVISMRWK